VFAYWTAPQELEFMGIMLDVPDHVQYFSWMREMTNGLLASNKLTPEPNPPLFFNLLWWSLGRFSKILGVGYPIAFQLLRVTATGLFLVLVYRVCSWFVPERKRRWTAFLLITFTSGFGWILVIHKYATGAEDLLFPLDVFVAEGNTFLGVLAYPHFIAAAAYILVFELFLRGQARGQLRYAVAAGLLAQWLGWQHAYDLVLIYGILGAYVVGVSIRIREPAWHLVKSLGIVGGLSFLPGLYSAALTSLDPVWQQVLAQFNNAGVFTPGPLHLPILLGPSLLLALWAIWRQGLFRIRDLSDGQLFLKTWLLTNLILIYLPVDFQIHMLNGIQVPMGILATEAYYEYLEPALGRLLRRLPFTQGPRLDAWLRALAIIIVIPTNVYLWTWRFVDISRHDYPYYLHRDEVAALNWLEGEVRGEDVVLGSLTLGQYVPALTGAHVFLGHWAQTLSFFEKRDIVRDFYSTTKDDAWRASVLEEYGVDYVLFGPAERALGSYSPNSSPLLTSAFEAGQVEVYEVLHQCEATDLQGRDLAKRSR
jgi:hypothetical protein